MQCTFNSLRNQKGQGILLLTPTPTQPLQKELLLTLDLIDFSGTILYSSMFIRKWSDLEKEKARIERNFEIVFVVSQDKRDLVDRLSAKERKLREFIKDSEEILDFWHSETPD